MNRLWLAGLAALLCLGAGRADAALTLEQVMADPDWIGAAVEQPFWALDGASVYYQQKRVGTPIRDLHRLDLASGKDSVVDVDAMAGVDARDPVFDADRHRAAFVRNGDVFVRDLASGRLTQLTKTPERESAPQFSADGRAVQYRRGDDWFVHDLASGVGAPAALLKLEKDPDAAPKPDDLRELQLRLFTTLKKADADKKALRDHANAQQRGDATRAPLPFYLGDDIRLIDTALSPNGRWLLAVTAVKAHDAGRVGKLTRFVTESGYEEFEDERTRVGRNDPAPQSLLLLDLEKHESHALAWSALPGIHDDPLKAVRAENAKSDTAPAAPTAAKDKKKEAAAKKDEPKERPLRVGDLRFSRDGSNVAIELRAVDNKDRWIASVDFATQRLESRHRLTDPAWINWSFNDFGWLNDNRTLWYLSEETGYAQLYTRTGDARPRALTHGEFEVSWPELSADGKWLYLRANREQPYSYDVYRVAVDGGELERITRVGALESFVLSADGAQLLLAHSRSYVPSQLALTASDGRGELRPLTDTRSAEFKAHRWLAPEIVAVPSSHTKAPIYAKLYKPADFDPAKRYPAVLFVHGAGYLQNVHLGYPAYFREQMFHNLLSERGYVVLDMDYRASEGYGRDWRTAIYRNMGHPELEDLIDGVRWLERNAAADPKRVGLYGGSYGGFMALMAMFRAPEVFSAGAALRPVTDWTQYNHEYTANILNDPQIDPLAYRRSSPIEFADGLQGPLLIAHGMIDDNVLFQDSVRLYQRLIELHKNDFEIAPYPLDRHGFSNADSWLDEYKRIYKLFEAHLK